MERSRRAFISPDEEDTLRRIGSAAAGREPYRTADIERLLAVGFIEAERGELRLTPVGRERLAWERL